MFKLHLSKKYKQLEKKPEVKKWLKDCEKEMKKYITPEVWEKWRIKIILGEDIEIPHNLEDLKNL